MTRYLSAKTVRHVIIAAITLLALLICVMSIRAYLRSWFAGPQFVEVCAEREGAYAWARVTERSSYWKCRDGRAALFLKTDYAESKDLSKAFLTLLTAVLVASITFSEKIVDIHRSSWWARGLMITAWLLFLLAITTCGTALALMTAAAGYATYLPQFDFGELEQRAVILYIIAGASFGCGLASLLVAGIVSLLDRPNMRSAAA